MRWSRACTGLVLLTVLVAVVFGCRQDVPPLFRQNRTPETTITVVVEESTTAFYRFHVFWRGEDADGQVVRYLFAITDTLAQEPDERWDPSLAVDRDIGTFTTRSDTVFLFDSGLGTQTLNIVAIDDFGAMDPSPARQFFRVSDNGTPRIEYTSVVDSRVGAVPCTAADACTISMYSDFTVAFRGSTPNGFLTGVTWSPNQGLFQPFNASNDTTFLEIPPPPAGLDTVVVGTTTIGTVDTLWSVDVDEVTVHHYSDRENPIPAGPFEYTVNMRDDARRQVIPPAGDRIVTVNYDPETSLYEIPECDCPTPPPGCDPQKMVPVGWVSGVNDTEFPLAEWRLFCPGDTLPNLSTVTFYATGQDDPRDGARDEGMGLEEVGYRFRFEFAGPTEVERRTVSRNMLLSRPALAATDLPLPGGGTFRGAAISWTTCSYDYKFQASAEDEQQRSDGTPATVDYMTSGSPTMDSLLAPKVIVFVPACPPNLAFICITPPVFGPDTLAVIGEHVPDPDGGFFAFGEGRYEFPFKAFAHDHPRDKNPPGQNWYSEDEIGRIRAWRYTFDCTTPLCQDQVLPGETAWRAEVRDEGVDPPNQEIFDGELFVTIQMDTFCTVTPCTFADAQLYLKSSRFGNYEFTLQARDTDPFNHTCEAVADLGDNPAIFRPDISEQGRRTKIEVRNVDWVQYRDVRPAGKPQLSEPFTNRKRLMK